ncbi:glutaredoxin family protein [Peribacillus cavernae]|uniref:glutaredoxin family protein n=1 Tax=Peribacillus cavernae TaxID=1674310 RepID=UPI0024830E12|nr:glutaredoxin family protein [Peribacillus cavernae]
MDCKAAKEFLSQHQIHYTVYDLSQNPDKEDEMKKRTGSRIVPAFVIKDKGLPGFIKRPKIFIGFEVNKEEITDLLNIQEKRS